MKSIDDFLSVEGSEDLENELPSTCEKYAVAANKVVSVEIESVVIGNRLRSVSKSKVGELAESIGTVGLLQPIAITEDKNLVAGLHRVEACRQLGIAEINAVVIPNLQLQKEIAEIDENLIRNQLTVLEQCEQLKRRKELYEALYPETRRGGYVRASSDELQPEDINDNRVVKDAFSNRAANERRVTPRTIQRAIRIAERLDVDVKNRIRDSPIAVRFTQMMRLAELEPLMQREIVAKMSDEKLSFPQAFKVCKRTGTESNQTDPTNSTAKTNRVVRKWVSSFSSLLKQFENFTLTEMQAVIERIKRDPIDFSALRRLSEECRESRNASYFEDREKTISADLDVVLPLFQGKESEEEGAV